jgi:hypothetical protein
MLEEVKVSLLIERIEHEEELMKKLEEYTRDHDWIKDNYQTLHKRYGEKYIAVKKQQVVADAKTIEELKAKLEPQGDLTEYVIEYLTEKPCNYLF